MIDGMQAAIAVPILNSYAHQYLRMPLGSVAIAAGERCGQWMLLVSHHDGVDEAPDLDAAKLLIDQIQARRIAAAH